MSEFLWGIDLGGTKIECAVMHAQTGECLIRERIATERNQGYTHILRQMDLLVAHCKKNVGLTPEAVGVATPGTLSPQSGLMKNCNTTELNGQPLDIDLAEHLQVPVTMANDANCFALAETHLGAVKQQYPTAKVVLGLILGTGVGSGIVVDGNVLSGRHGIAGEWGHNCLEPGGDDCYCGRQGCVETVISGPAIERYYRRKTGEDRRLADIVLRADAGEQTAIHTINYLVDRFGEALAPVVNVLDPDVIVIGGGVSNVTALYQLGGKAILRTLFNPRFETPLVRPVLGDSAGVFGAAMLVR
ncbi:Fructokinase [BD1-7 clade bacterium]|uniref:Fructokinase n=1 Tax=BD1-7 clade bacterium TaxID=2029982 RepID=A0A5S9QDJ1_9GAMM|nr:Fructokinase [BD1-7 clade bacterium]